MPLARLGRFLVLLVALGGLFAMHGMSDHGTGGPGEVASSISATHPSAAHLKPAALVTSGERHDMGDGLPSRPSHDHGTEVAGLCLAVMVAVLLIGGALGTRWHHRLRAWLPGSDVGRLTAACLRVVKPPDHLAFSIQRC